MVAIRGMWVRILTSNQGSESSNLILKLTAKVKHNSGTCTCKCTSLLLSYFMTLFQLLSLCNIESVRTG
jgi:hypothetical protein